MLLKSMKQIGKSEYDRDTDILYVHFANDRGDSYGFEEDNGVEVFKDCSTDEITGFQVYHIRNYEEERQKQMHEMGLDYDLNQLCEVR